MPLYVYGCPECAIELEELRPAWRADEPVECPICHGLCTREVSRFHTPARPQPQPLYASPQQVAQALHGADCACCRSRRRPAR